MAQIDNAEILEWINAPEVDDTLKDLSLRAREAAASAEKQDRSLLIDTAIGVGLIVAGETLSAEIKDKKITRGEIDALLRQMASPKPLPEIVPEVPQGPISPFSLLTTGITFKDRVSQGDHYKSLKARIAEKLGIAPEQGVIRGLNKVSTLLSGVGPSSQLLPSDSFDIHPGKGVTFNNPKLTVQDLSQHAGIGPKTAEQIIELAEAITQTHDYRQNDSTLIDLAQHRESRDQQATG